MMVIKENRIEFDLKTIRNSIHILSDERNKRKRFLSKMNKMEIQKSFWVNKGHPNGPEIHLLTTDGIILVINARTFKLCTILIARPKQIEKYYKAIFQDVPENLIIAARLHQWIGANEPTEYNKKKKEGKENEKVFKK